MLNLRLLFKNQKKLTLSLVFKWLDISELKMPKLVDLCVKNLKIRYRGIKMAIINEESYRKHYNTRRNNLDSMFHE